MWSIRVLRKTLFVATALFALYRPGAASPLVLYDPNAADPAAAPNTLTSKTTAPGKACGDLSTPCQNLAAAQGAPLPPLPGPGQDFTYGGSLSTTIVGSNHGVGAGLAASGWVQSPDGDWTLAVSVAHFSPGGLLAGQPALTGGFGRQR